LVNNTATITVAAAEKIAARRKQLFFVRFEVLTAVAMKNVVSWDIKI
jgi:hypothetical protein